MGSSNLNEWVKVMEDKEILKILFYLREFNPSVTIEDLNENLGIDKEKIKEKIDTLKKLEIIEQQNLLFKLSDEGRNMVDGFYKDLGEAIPNN